MKVVCVIYSPTPPHADHYLGCLELRNGHGAQHVAPRVVQNSLVIINTRKIVRRGPDKGRTNGAIVACAHIISPIR
jgi:hypothetical protein